MAYFLLTYNRLLVMRIRARVDDERERGGVGGTGVKSMRR